MTKQEKQALENILFNARGILENSGASEYQHFDREELKLLEKLLEQDKTKQWVKKQCLNCGVKIETTQDDYDTNGCRECGTIE